MLSFKRKKQVVEGVISNKITIIEASHIARRHPRTIKRWIAKYLEHGEKGLVHGNKGKASGKRINLDIVETYINKNNYQDLSFEQLSEFLGEDSVIDVSASCLRKRFLEMNIISPFATKKTRKKLRKKLRKLQKEQALNVNEADLLLCLENESKTGTYIHPSKSKSKYFGERIEMDACEINLFGDTKKWTMHVAIDDATGFIVGLWIEEQETLHGYYKVLEQVLCKYGIPHSIKTDKRSVFIYNGQSDKRPENDIHTQFSYACYCLGIKLNSCSIPEFKPKVERANGTLQRRLPNRVKKEELRTVADVNDYLITTYIDFFNAKFGYGYDIQSTDKKLIQHRFVPIDEEQIRMSLVLLTERVVNDNNCISFKNQKYVLYKENGSQVFLGFRTKLDVIETLDKEIYVKTKSGKLYYTQPLEDRKSWSPNFDSEEDKPIRTRPKFRTLGNHSYWSTTEQIEFKRWHAQSTIPSFFKYAN